MWLRVCLYAITLDLVYRACYSSFNATNYLDVQMTYAEANVFFLYLFAALFFGSIIIGWAYLVLRHFFPKKSAHEIEIAALKKSLGIL